MDTGLKRMPFGLDRTENFASRNLADIFSEKHDPKKHNLESYPSFQELDAVSISVRKGDNHLRLQPPRLLNINRLKVAETNIITTEMIKLGADTLRIICGDTVRYEVSMQEQHFCHSSFQ